MTYLSQLGHTRLPLPKTRKVPTNNKNSYA